VLFCALQQVVVFGFGEVVGDLNVALGDNKVKLAT
jgi:hypothetical protein